MAGSKADPEEGQIQALPGYQQKVIILTYLQISVKNHMYIYFRSNI